MMHYDRKFKVDEKNKLAGRVVKLKTKTPFEYIFRRISFICVKYLAKTRITPNQVTLIRLPIILLASYQFYLGQYFNLILGAICLWFWEVLDHVDGDLATVKNQKTEFGGWLDVLIDRPFGKLAGLLGFAITLGLYRQNQDVGVWIILFFLVFGDYSFSFFLNSGKASRGQSEREDKERSFSPESEDGDVFHGRIKKLVSKIYYLIFYWELQVIAILAVLNLPINKVFGVNSLYLGLIFFSVSFNLFWIGVVVMQCRNFLKGRQSNN